MEWHRKFTAGIALLGILFVQLHGLWLHKMTTDATASMMLCPMHSMMAAPSEGEPEKAPPPSNQTSRFCPIANARDHAFILAEAPKLTAGLTNAVLDNPQYADTETVNTALIANAYQARGPPSLS